MPFECGTQMEDMKASLEKLRAEADYADQIARSATRKSASFTNDSPFISDNSLMADSTEYGCSGRMRRNSLAAGGPSRSLTEGPAR